MEELFQDKAIRLVESYMAGRNVNYDLRIVWFCKTLKNWKAIIADINSGGYLFEVTYSGEHEETYLDVYTKTDGVRTKD